MKIQYKLFAFLYDLIDVLYFNRELYSPRTALLALIPDAPVNVLDACAGTGSNCLLIARHKPEAQVTALDLSADMLKRASKKFHQAGIVGIQTIVADAGNTGFADNSFDVILLSLVLHETGCDIRKTIINEARRIVSGDGRIIVIEWKQPQKPFQRFMFWFIKQMEPEGFKNFLKMDLPAYFNTFGLSLIEKRSCDYTHVFALTKD
ncbi:MAG: class I SAM-dependent methyltransferase [Dehalococcoidia bacterium]|nr:class I SAM-dependent methyltransferase [Dehalococcoidia bacterium]